MEYTTAENFAIAHGGFDAIERFQELLNIKVDVHLRGRKRKRHLTLKEISKQMNLSTSQVCRLRNAMFETQWVTRRGTKEYVENQIHSIEKELKRRADFIDEQNKLQFIAGSLCEQYHI